MSDTETRIVEMRFDSRDFDKPIAKSQKTLDDFKKALNFDETSKGLKEFASNMNNIDFSGMARGIEKLTDKFTGLGDAGEWVLSRIRSGIEEAMLKVESFIKSFTTAQIDVGQGKYDAMNKAAQSLIATGKYTEEQAYEVFERVMEYTDQTSANFQSMVDSLASFVSTGQGLQSSEKALEGIFNMTAKAGRGASEASAAMTTFSKAMGQGYLSKNNWDSLMLSSRIVTEDFRKQILEAAVATGDLVKQGEKYYVATKYRNKETEKQTKKNAKSKEKEAQKEADTLSKYEVTADSLENTLSKKWMSKDTMMAIFDKYYFAKLTGATEEELESFAGVAYKSAQRALTFADAMNAVKESISSGWMNSFRLIFGDVTDAMKLFTDLCERVIDSIYGIQEARNSILESWSLNGGRTALIDAVLGDYGKEVETGAYGLIDLFEDVGNVIADGFWDMVKIFTGATDENNWDKEGFKEAWLGLKLSDISKQIRDFIASIKSFFTEEVKIGDKTTTRLEMIQNVIKGIEASLIIAADIVGGVLFFVDGLHKQLQPTILTIEDFFSELGKILYDTANDTHKSKGIQDFFNNLLESLKPLTSTINDVTAKLSDLLLTFIKWGIESGFFESVFKGLNNLFVKFNGILTRIVKPMIMFLGDLFVIFKELFDSGFDPAVVAQVGDKIKVALDTMFSSIFGVESLEKLGEKFKDKFKEVLNNLYEFAPDWVKEGINAIKDLFGLWNENDGGRDTIFTRIHDFFENGFGGVWDFIQNIFNSFQNINMHDLIKTGFGFKSLSNLLKTVTGWFKGTNLYTVIMAVLGVLTLWDLFKVIHNIKQLGQNLKWAVGEIAESFKSGFKVRYDDYGEYLMKMAEGIAIFVACVAVLGSMKTGNLIQGIVALGLVMAAVFLFNKVLKKDFDNDSLKDQLGFAAKLIALGLAITSITAAVALLALALVPLGKLSLGGWIQSMLGLIIILGALTTFAWGLKKLQLTTVHLTGLLTVTLAVAILVLSVVPFALMSWEAFARSLVGMIAVLGVVTLFAWGLKKLTLTEAGLKGLIAVSVAVAILVLSVVPFALMSWEAFARSLVGMLAVLAIVTLFALGLKKLDLNAAGLKGLIAVSTGILILVISIIPFALMTWAAFARSILGMVAVLAALTLFALGLKKLDLSSTKLKGLLILAASIAILMVSMIPLALMDWGGFARAMIGLIVMLGSLALFSYGLKKFELETAKLIGLIGLVAAIGLLSIMLNSFANMSWEGWAKAMLGLVVVVGILTLFALAVKSMDLNTVKLAGLLGFVGGIVLICNNLDKLAAMSWEGWAKAMLGLLVIFALILGVNAFLKGGDLKASIGALLIMVGVVLIIVSLSFALNEIKNINPNLITTFSTLLITMIAAVVVAVAILQAVPLAAGLKAMLLLGVGIIAISAILAIAIPLLLDTIGDSMAEFSAKLKLIAQIIKDFSESMNGVDESGVKKAEDLFGRLKRLIASLDGASSLSSTVSDFTTALYDLGTGFFIFNAYVKDLPDPDSSPVFKMVDKLIGYADTLSGFSVGNFANEIYGLGLGLYAFNYLGGEMTDGESKPLKLLQDLAGCATDLQTLSTLGLETLKGQLAGLGGAMMLYAEGAQEVTGVEGDQTSNVQGAVAILRAITQTFADEGGFVLPEVPSEQELGSFGADLAALAGAIVKFAEASNGLGKGTDKAIELLGFLSDLKEKLIADDIKVANVFGDAGVSHDVLEQFGLDIISLGTSIKNFVDNTQGIDEGKIKVATSALDFFRVLRGKLMAQNAILSVLSFFSGEVKEDQLTAFGKNIEQLGLGLKSFATSVNLDETTQGNFETALEALGFLQELESKLPKIGGVVSLITGTQQTLTDLAAQVILLGEAIASFNDSITDENGNSKLNNEAMTSALDILNGVVTLLGRLQTEMEPVGGFLSFFTGHQYDASNLKDDIESFKGVVAELVNINTLLNGEDQENPIPDSTKMTAAIELLDVITSFIKDLGAKMPESRPLLEVFTGEKYNTKKLKEDMTNFKSVISELAIASDILNGGDDSVQMLDATTIEPALAAIDLVLGFVENLGNKMPKDNTFLDDFFTGEKYNTDKLKSDIENFKSVISELVGISKLLNGKDETNPMPDKDLLEPALSSIDMITTFVKDLGIKMPHNETFLAAFTGTKYNLTNLKTDISSFSSVCEELAGVSEKLSGKGTDAVKIDSDAMETAKTSVDTVLDFSRKLGETMEPVGGFVQTIEAWYGGHTFNLTDLQTELRNFGDVCTELVGISSTLIGENGSSPLVTESVVTSATKVIDQILAFSRDLAEKAPKVGGMEKALGSLIHGSDYSFENLKNDLTMLGQGFGGFTAGIGTDFDPDKAIAAIDVAQGITEVIANLATMGGGEYEVIDRNTGSIAAFLNAMNEGYKGWVGGEQQDLPPMIAIITELAKAISDAMDLAGGVKLSNIQVFEQMARGLQHLSQIDPTFDFEPVGINIGTGIEKGIRETETLITEATREVVRAAYIAGMSEIDANSPSKLFMNIGDFMTAGMAIGIEDGTIDVTRSITDMSSETVNTATSVLGIISQLLGEELDTNPTITPVLDLTDLSNGIVLMNGMLEGGRMSINASGAAKLTASNLPNDYSDSNQNGIDLSGVYDRMAALGDKISLMGDQIAKMKIVLDTGVIAGAVTDQVDANIGAKTFYAGRGN